MSIDQETLETDPLVKTLLDLRARLGRAGDGASARFTADSRLVEGLRAEAQVRQFSFTVDEPTKLGGTDQGPSPVELVLAALGTCQEILYATYARVLGIPIDGVSVKATASLDPRGFFGVADVPAGFREVSFTVDITGPAAPEDVERLIAAVNEHCPVLDILRRPLPVKGTYSLNGAAVAPPD